MSRGSFGEVYRGAAGEIVMVVVPDDDGAVVILRPTLFDNDHRAGPPGTLDDTAILSDTTYWQLLPDKEH